MHFISFLHTEMLCGSQGRPDLASLTHWGRVTHICVGKLTIIGSDNGLLPGRCQAIIWINAGILLIEPLGTNLSEILIGIQIFSFKKMHLKRLSAKWHPFCLGLNMLILSWLLMTRQCEKTRHHQPWYWSSLARMIWALLKKGLTH